MQDYFQNYIQAVTSPLPEMVDYFEKENNYLKNLVNKNSVVLDVGCGNGRTMKFLASYAKRIVGIDYDFKMINIAEENLSGISNIELLYKDFFDNDFKEKFDLVFASYNLLGSAEINFNQRKALLNKMISVVKNNGHVVLSVWTDTGIDFANTYYPSIGIKVLKIENSNVVTDQGIFKRFSKEELKNIAEDVSTDYKIVELNQIFYLLDIKI